MNVTLSLNPEGGKKFDGSSRMPKACHWTNTFRIFWLVRPVFPVTKAQPHKQFDNLSGLLLNSPLAGADLDLERPKHYSRPVDLG